MNATTATGVALAGSNPDRLPRRVVWIERDRADRVDGERTAQVRPGRLLPERIIRPPDAALRRADPQATVARLAGGRHGDGIDAARCRVLIGDVVRESPQRGKRIERRARTH